MGEMKRGKSGLGRLVLAAAVLAAACGSGPKPVETPAPGGSSGSGAAGVGAQAGRTGTRDAAQEAARQAALEARKLAGDFGAPDYFPDEWAGASALYDRAEGGSGGGDYGDAEKAFSALAEKAIEQYAQDKEREILAAREAAIAAGARQFGPGFLRDADTVTLDAKADYEARDFYAAKKKADAALARYRALEAGAAAYSMRLDLADAGLLDGGAEADEALREAIAAWGDENITAAGEAADRALRSYEALLAGALASLAEKAAEERQNAVNLKAPVAAAEEFASADEVFSAAESGEADGEAAGARLYIRASVGFALSGRLAERKRTRAEQALAEAERKTAESGETAREAELLLESEEGER